MKQPRAINQELVDAYLARRALDYLVGFTLSCPVAEATGFEIGRPCPIRRTTPHLRAAEIEIFVPQEYWSVTGQFETARAFRSRRA